MSFQNLKNKYSSSPIVQQWFDNLYQKGYDTNLINNFKDLENAFTDDPTYFYADASSKYFPSDYDYGPAAESAQMFETGGVPRIGDSDYTIDDLRMQGMSEDDILNLLRKLSAKGYEI